MRTQGPVLGFSFCRSKCQAIGPTVGVAVILLFVLLPLFCQAAVPPTYLSVQDFENCLATEKMDLYSAWCLPAKKPIACSNDAWTKLNADTLDSMRQCRKIERTIGIVDLDSRLYRQ